MYCLRRKEYWKCQFLAATSQILQHFSARTVKCLTLLLGTRRKTTDVHEDCRAQSTLRESHNKFKIMTSWLYVYLVAGYNNSTQPNEGWISWQDRIQFPGAPIYYKSIQGTEESAIHVIGTTLKRCVQNVMPWEKLLLPLTKLHPTLSVAHLGSKLISKGALFSISAKWYESIWYYINEIFIITVYINLDYVLTRQISWGYSAWLKSS